jgi:hypothetical protein
MQARREPSVSKKTETAAQFIACVRDKQYADAGQTLAEDVVMALPQVGPITGRSAVETALRMASESRRGLERVGWSAPVEREDGTVLLPGKAPGGMLGAIAKLMKKQVALSMTCSFAEDDKISRIELAAG